jgi:hypothetical protein
MTSQLVEDYANVIIGFRTHNFIDRDMSEKMDIQFWETITAR